MPHHTEPNPQVLGLTWVRCTPETGPRTDLSAVEYFFGRELLRELKMPVGLLPASFGAAQIESWLPPAAFTDDPVLTPLRHVRHPAWTKGMPATELHASMIQPLVP